MASIIVETEDNSKTISETDNIRNAITGDKNSFKVLYETHSGRIFSFAKRISIDDDLAKEVTQKTFIKAWENLGEFKFNSSFQTWLQKIALNEFLMEIRSSSRSSKRNEEYSDTLSSFQSPVVSEKMDIENSINSLPENQRIVFCLFHIEGFSIKEVSALLGVSDGTVKSQLHDARKKLIKELQK